MTTESVLNEVRQRLGPLNEQAEEAVAEALNLIRRKFHSLFSAVAEEAFRSENATLDEYLNWTDEQQRRYQSEAERENIKWIEKRLDDLHATWLIVVDGKIIAHGPSLQTFPHEEEFEALCEKLGKYPFVIFSPRMFLIEEAAGWHPTEIPGDAYPVISVAQVHKNHFCRVDLRGIA